MKNINFLLICITTIVVSISLNSCSKDDDKEELIGTIKINGNNHKILEAGYTTSLEHDLTCIQFIIEDSGDAYNYNHSFIEIQIPTTLTEDWFTLTKDNPNWTVMLRNFIVGNTISEGRVLIKRLGNNDKENKCKFQVSFEISLADGTTAVADVHAKFQNSILWIGGR